MSIKKTKTQKCLAVLIALAMVFTSMWMTTSTASAASKAPKKIALKATTKKVDIKGKAKVSVKSVSPKGTSKTVTWKTSNRRVATVSKKGVVTGKKAGKVKITAISKKNRRVKKSITITVKNIKPKLTISQKQLILDSGKTKTLKVKVGPTGVYNKGVKWKSSNKGIAKVSSKGVVTAVNPGTATITVYSKESSKYKATCKVTVQKKEQEPAPTPAPGEDKVQAITSDPGSANQYKITADLLSYKQAGDLYIATVGDWRKENKISDKSKTYFQNGEALSDHDIIVSNGKMGFVLAVGTRNPWGYPAGSVLDAGYIKNGTPARDTIWSLEFLMNGWDSWAPENCGTVTFDLASYDFEACKESKDGLPAVKVSRIYNQLADKNGKMCNLDVVTYYSLAPGADYAYMFDTVANNGTAAIDTAASNRTRFAMTNKGDDGGAMKTLQPVNTIMSYGNKDGQEYATCHTVPRVQSDQKVKIDKFGGSLGYKELRASATYAPGETTVYQEYFMASERADTKMLTDFLNKANKEETMTITGQVKDNAGAGTVSDAVVIVKEDSDKVYGFYRADKDGNYSINLPKGSYQLYTECKGYGKGAIVNAQAAGTFDLKTGPQKQKLEIDLTDTQNSPLWGKAEILNEYPEVRYTGNSVYQAKEKGKIIAEVSDLSSYEATIYPQGYFFYTDTVSLNGNGNAKVTVKADKKYALQDGWLSADMHHHANKNDGFADPEDAVPSFLASGLDVAFITDHDFTVNNKKAYDLVTQTYKDQMKGFVPSEEISCSWAHFNVLPQNGSSYDFFLDKNRENHVMDQFSKFPEFVKQTHDKGATITANHPWYSYGLYYSARKDGGVPGGYQDDYDNIEINACSSDQENADVLISAQALWNEYLSNGEYMGAAVKKPHYLLGGSDTHDVLIPGVTNKGQFARGESEHYNSGKVRTIAEVGSTDGKNVVDTGLAFTKAVAEGHSYVSFGPILEMDQKPGAVYQLNSSEAFKLKLDAKSLTDIKEVIVMTGDSKDNYESSTLVGSYQKDSYGEYIKYDKELTDQAAVIAGDKKSAAVNLELSVDSGKKTWISVLVMDANGNYAVTNPFWVEGK